MRKIGLRYRLLRGGAYYAELRAVDSSAPRIRMDDGGEIKTSFTGTFAPYARDAAWRLREIDWLSDEIQPVLVTDRVEHPLGVFAVATPTEDEIDGLRSVRVEAYDRAWKVRDTRTEQLLYFRRGTLILDAVEQLLTAAGIKAIFKTPSLATFQEDREDWDVGTSHLSIANQLLKEINYNDVWFDPSGAAVLGPVTVPEAAKISHRFDTRDKFTRVIPGISRTTDVFSAPNVWICTCANPDKDELMVAVAANENPQSPLSTVRRGRRISAKIPVDNVYSQEDLQAYANRLRNESMITGETIQLSTGLLPGFGVGDVVALRYGGLSALCIERGFDMELAVGGRMTHRLEKVVYNLD